MKLVAHADVVGGQLRMSGKDLGKLFKTKNILELEEIKESFNPFLAER